MPHYFHVKRNSNVTKQETAIVIFKEKNIRRVWHKDEWYFAVVDVVAALTDSVNPSDYIKKIRMRDNELTKGWVSIR